MSNAPTKSGPVAESKPLPQGPQPRPVKITPPADGFVESRGPTKRFWIGTIKACPYQNVDCGGHSFPRYVEDVDFDGETTTRTKRPGAFVHLDEAGVKRVCDAVSNKVMRMIGKERPDGSRRGQLISRSGQNDKPFRPQQNDQPLGRFLYMIEVPSGMGDFVAMPGTPETMVD